MRTSRARVTYNKLPADARFVYEPNEPFMIHSCPRLTTLLLLKRNFGRGKALQLFPAGEIAIPPVIPHSQSDFVDGEIALLLFHPLVKFLVETTPHAGVDYF